MLYTVDVNIFFSPLPPTPALWAGPRWGPLLLFIFIFFLNVTHIGQPKH